jgi:pSer/pThr/pTyr-binding forkhead associated (FHA) protein
VLFNGQEIALKEGTAVIGRSPSCQLVVDDMLVSRKHARLLISDVSLIIEDLSSTNGVYVNDRLVVTPTALDHGDRVLVGPAELSILARKLPERRRHADAGDEPDLSSDERSVETGSHRMPTTTRRDAFSTVGRVADRMLAMGRADGAAQLIGGHLKEVLAAARSGHQIAPDLRDATTHYALQLGALGKDPIWVNLAIELNLLGKRPLRAEAVEQLTQLARTPGLVERELLFYYQEILRANLHRMSPAELERTRRILDLAPPN